MDVYTVIGNIESRIVGYLPEEVNDQIEKTLRFRPAGIEHSEKVKKRQWDGYINLYKRARRTYPTGLQSIVASILKENNIEYSRKDMREIPMQNLTGLRFTPTENYEQREYQKITIERAIKATRGILKVATGGGKTILATELISRIKTGPFMFYVLTKDLLEQTHDVMSTYLNLPIGKIGNGECDIQAINVCTIQTCIHSINKMCGKIKLKDFKDYIYDDADSDAWREEEIISLDKMESIYNIIKSSKGFFFDECHHASARTVRDVVNASPQAYWKFGGSATPWREDNADIMIQAMLGRKIVDINASYLIERGYLCQPNIIMSPVKHNIKYHNYKTIYKECISSNNKLNDNIVKISKYLMAKGLSVLILVQQYSHGDYIKAQMNGIEFVTGKMSKQKRKQSLEDIKNGKTKCIIGTTLYDEGIDCPSLDAVILAGGGASCTRIYQRIGRVLRKNKSNKDKALVVYFKHDAKYLKEQAAKVKKIIKTEPLFKIINGHEGLEILSDIDFVYGWSNENSSLFST